MRVRLGRKGAFGSIHVYIGMATIFVSVFMLFFVFHSLEQLAESCKTEHMPICDQFTGFTHSMIVILLIISGFVITTTATMYIMFSAG